MFVQRRKIEVKDILFTQGLSCYPYQKEAFEIVTDYLNKHPDLNMKDLDINVDEKEIEEDHYGNGGGIRRTLIISKVREETDAEYENRIKTEENAVFKRHLERIEDELKFMLRALDFDIKPADAKELVNAFLTDIRSKICEIGKGTK